MLNGLAPVLIFAFPVKPKGPTFNALAGIPLIGDSLANSVGVPIPLYLDEKLTGILVESESKAVDIETNVQPRNDGGPPLVDQRTINSTVTINMVANKDSLILSALLAFNDLIIQKVVSKEYTVSYLNGSTLIFGGLLHGLTTSEGSDDTLIRISLTLSKANTQNTQILPQIPTLTPVTGATPIGG